MIDYPAPLWLKLAMLLCVVLSGWLTYDRCMRRLHPRCIAWLAGSLIGTLAFNTVVAFVDNHYGFFGFVGNILLWWWLLWVPGGLTALMARTCWRKIMTHLSTRKVVGCAKHGTRNFPISRPPTEPKRKFGPEEEVIFLASCFLGSPGAAAAAIMCCGVLGACLDEIVRAVSPYCASL